MVFGRYNELIRTINHGGFVMVIWMVNHIYMDGLWMFMVDITNYKSWGFCDGKKTTFTNNWFSPSCNTHHLAQLYTSYGLCMA